MNQETVRKTYEKLLSASSVMTDEEREKLLRQCVTEDVKFSTPMGQSQGFDNMLKDVARAQQQFPGASVRCEVFFAHHGEFLGDRTLFDKDGRPIRAPHIPASGDQVPSGNEGQPLRTGYSYGRYNEDGKFTWLTGFFEV